MKHTGIYKKLLAVVIALVMIFSTVPVTTFALTETITSWTSDEVVDGKHIVRITEDAIIKADIPEDFIVIVESGNLYIPYDITVNVYGTVWLKGANSEVLTEKNEDQIGKIVIKKGVPEEGEQLEDVGGGAFVRGSYPVFGYDEIDLKQETGIGSTPLVPCVLLDNLSVVTISTNDGEGSAIVIDSSTEGTSTTIKTNRPFIVGTKDILTIGKDVCFSEESTDKIVSMYNGKVYNHSNDVNLLNALKNITNGGLYHLVSWKEIENGTESEQFVSYVKSGESFSVSAGEGKVFTTVDDRFGSSSVINSSTFNVDSISAPESYTLTKDIAKYDVTFVPAENGVAGVTSPDDESVLLPNAIVNHNESVTFAAKPDDGYKCIGFDISEGNYTSLNNILNSDGDIIGAEISGITGAIKVNAKFAEIYVSSLVIETQSNAGNFYPESQHSFTAKIVPENAKIKEVEWSLESVDGQPLDAKIATIKSNGILKIGSDATTEDSFYVVAKSLSKENESDESIVAKYLVSVIVVTDKDIKDYFVFKYNSEEEFGEYDSEKWSGTDVQIDLKDLITENDEKYCFSYSEDDTVPYFSNATVNSVSISESNQNIRLRVYKLDKDENIIEVIDFGGVVAKIDKDAPVINYMPEFNEESWFSNATINFTVSEEGSGIKRVYYTKENTPDAPSTEVEFDAEGNCSFSINSDTTDAPDFYLWAVDTAGNISVANNFKIKVDATAPVAEISVHSEIIASAIEDITFGLIKINSTTKVDIKAYDKASDDKDGSGIASIQYKYVIDGANDEMIDWQSIDCKKQDASFPILVEESLDAPQIDGLYSIYLMVTDAMGNVTELKFVASAEADNEKGLEVNNKVATFDLQLNAESIESGSTNYLSNDNFEIKAVIAGEGSQSDVVTDSGKVTVRYNDGQPYDIGATYDSVNGFVINKDTFETFLANNPATDFSGMEISNGNLKLKNGSYAFSTEISNKYGITSVDSCVLIVDDEEPEIDVKYFVDDKHDDSTYQIEKILSVTPTVGCSGLKSLEVIDDNANRVVLTENNNGEYLYAVNESKVYTFIATNNAGVEKEVQFNAILVNTEDPTLDVVAQHIVGENEQDYSGKWINEGYVSFILSNSKAETCLGKETYQYSVDDGKTWITIQEDVAEDKVQFKVEEECETTYLFKVIAENKEESEQVESTVKLDKTAAVIEEIKYVNNVSASFIDNITFAIFFKQTASVKVVVKDSLSGASKITLEGISDSGENDFSVDADSITDSLGSQVAKFNIPEATFKGTLKVIVTDNANNVSEATNSETSNRTEVVIVDRVAPIINSIVFDDGTPAEGFHNDNEKTIRLEVTEANFMAEDVMIKISATDDNGKSIETLDSDLIAVDGRSDTYTLSNWTKKDGTISTYVNYITFTEDGDYGVRVSYTDRSLNIAEKKTAMFTIDSVAPVINVSYSSTETRVDEVSGKKFFAKPTTMTIEVVEHNFEWNSGTDFTITATDINGKSVKLPKLSAWKNSADNNVHTATLRLPDAIYSIDVKTTDKALNTTTYETEKIVVDTTSADVVSIRYANKIVRPLISNLTFGVFFKDTAEVIVNVKDVTTGVKSVVLKGFLEDGTIAFEKIQTYEEKFDIKEGNSASKANFTIDALFRGELAVEVIDYVGNVISVTNSEISDDVPSDGKEVIIVDNVAPVIKDLGSNSGITAGTHYQGEKTVAVIIEEDNFFGDDVVIKVDSADDNGKEIKLPSKDLYLDSSDATGKSYKAEEWFVDNNGNHYAEITFTKDGDYSLTVEYTDKSGNVAESKEISFTIDNTAPLIEVSYNREPVFESEKTGKKYFGDATVATVKITEHNFNWDPKTDFIITATDINGNKIEVPTLGAWFSDESINVHTAEIELRDDAIYTIDVQNTDKSGNNTVYDTEEIVIDKTGSEIIELTYENSVFRSLINAVTFGVFFKDTAEVTVDVVDMTAGIKQIKLLGILEENASSVNKSFEESITFEEKDDAKNKNSEYQASFVIPAQFRGTLLVKVTDYAGIYSEATNSSLANNLGSAENETVIVDNTAPVISDIEKKSNISNGTYYNTDQTVIIEVNEANFFAEDVKIVIETKDDLGKAITDLDQDLVPVENEPNTYYFTTWQRTDSDVYSKSILFDVDGDYKVTVKYSDRSGNVAKEESVNFTIDKTAPVIDITYDAEAVFINKETENHYYNKVVTATIAITEHNFNWQKEDIQITAKDISGNSVKVPVLGSWTTNENNVHTAQVVFSEDAIYTLDVQTTDLAKNNTAHSTEYFVIDTTLPEITGIVFSENKEDIDSFESTTFSSYKYFSNGDTTVEIFAKDITSGIQEISLYGIDYSDDAAGKKVEFNPSSKNFVEGQREVKYSFVLPASFKGNIYAQATDYSFNKSDSDSDDGFTKSIGVVIEDANKHKETLEMDIKANVEPNENGFYNADLPITFTVKDNYSGIHNLTYKVGSSDAVQVDFLDEKDVTYVWTQDLVVNAASNNNNKVEVFVSYVDNAGNPHQTKQTFQVNYKIDVTDPVISVTYDNNKSANELYFNANRVATVTIEELNFDVEDVIFTITRDGSPYTAIIPSADSWKHDNINHSVKIAFATDGDYTFDVSYTDLAQNKNKGVNYNNSVAATKFTIDKTKPVIREISFNNNNALNGNYYNSSRSATIVIREHNFIPSKSLVIMSANNDGTQVAIPTPSSWKNIEPDVYSAVVNFTNDAVYKITASSVDLADNTADEFPEQEFCIDNIDPEVVVTNIVPSSANKDKVAPVIKVTDTNIDYSNVSVTLVGNKRGQVACVGKIENPHNGYIFTFDNIEKEKENDDIYTLSVVATDMAGRTNKFITAFDANGKSMQIKENQFRFSVNRFGSTYLVSSDVLAMNGKVVKQANDVVIQEINPNKLSNQKIIIYKGGSSAIELVENEDYKVEVTGGNGSWYTYTYTIFKKNFTEEGFYSIDISSLDEAGNVAQNTLDTKNQRLEFGIDATKPKINITNLENNSVEEVESYYRVVINVSDLSLSNVSIFLDGAEITPEIDGYDYSFYVKGSTSLSESKHSLKVIAVDNAGNTHTVSIDEFTITTSRLVALLSNRIVVFSAVGALASIVALSIVLIIVKRRKDDENQEQF